jgi:hypothetical protein
MSFRPFSSFLTDSLEALTQTPLVISLSAEPICDFNSRRKAFSAAVYFGRIFNDHPFSKSFSNVLGSPAWATSKRRWRVYGTMRAVAGATAV